MEIDEVKNEVALDPLTMLQEATYRIKVLEEKLKKSQKVNEMDNILLLIEDKPYYNWLFVLQS